MLASNIKSQHYHINVQLNKKQPTLNRAHFLRKFGLKRQADQPLINDTWPQWAEANQASGNAGLRGFRIIVKGPLRTPAVLQLKNDVIKVLVQGRARCL